ncbi:hypothetical protein, partial [Phocaeicola sp.]|uniref:hypothetical protein n=1 Tax=Phocaeicola sp. TaxID=2773926 RepID=UPI003AB36607
SRSSNGRKRAGYIERPGAGWLQGRWYALILPLLYQTLLKQKCKQLENVSDWKQSSQSTI